MPRESVIVSDPEILGGTPCFRGTRVPVDSLIDYLEAGDSLGEFLDNFPSVSREAAFNLSSMRISPRPLILRDPTRQLRDMVRALEHAAHRQTGTVFRFEARNAAAPGH